MQQLPRDSLLRLFCEFLVIHIPWDSPPSQKNLIFCVLSYIVRYLWKALLLCLCAEMEVLLIIKEHKSIISRFLVGHAFLYLWGISNKDFTFVMVQHWM